MEILLASIIAFASTNLDDLFLLTLFYANREFNGREIVLGQLLGIITLIAISAVGSLIGLVIDHKYVGLLGVIPVFLGARGIVNLFRSSSDDVRDNRGNEKRSKTLTVAGVTIANGGDNVGIYIPLFATIPWFDTVVMIVVFLAMTFLWCILARYFTNHRAIEKVVERYGHVVTPFVLIGLGIFILYRNDTWLLFSSGD